MMADLGLATKIPKNRLKIYLDNLKKSSNNLKNVPKDITNFPNYNRILGYIIEW